MYLAIAADGSRADTSALARLAVVLSLPQVYGLWRRAYERRNGLATVRGSVAC